MVITIWLMAFQFDWNWEYCTLFVGLFNARCSLLVVNMYCTLMKINSNIIDCSVNHKYQESDIEVQRYHWLIKVLFCYSLPFISVGTTTFDWIDFWVFLLNINICIKILRHRSLRRSEMCKVIAYKMDIVIVL